jgi:hypothetical protein
LLVDAHVDRSPQLVADVADLLRARRLVGQRTSGLANGSTQGMAWHVAVRNPNES